MCDTALVITRMQRNYTISMCAVTWLSHYLWAGLPSGDSLREMPRSESSAIAFSQTPQQEYVVFFHPQQLSRGHGVDLISDYQGMGAHETLQPSGLGNDFD